MVTPAFQRDGVTIYCGDALEVARALPAESVNCCVTSPPYWGLRDYGIAGQLGLERTPQEYVERLVAILAAVRGALRDDGTLWLNLGDTYNAYNGNRGKSHGPNKNHLEIMPRLPQGAGLVCEDLKQKDLIGIPWRVALALQADGWFLRSDIIWHKPNPMPESVTDRPTKSHEYIFLLSKSERYHYDHEAIKEPAIYGDPRKPYAPGQVDSRGNGHDRNGGSIRESVKRGGFAGKHGDMAFRAIEDCRNKRTVWTVPTRPFRGAHFAVFPPQLIEPCIKAGCPEGGIVLDPFLGSGTTAQVALANGCQCIGIELNPAYIELAAKRFRQRRFALGGLSDSR